MPTLIDRATGKVVQVPDEQAAGAVQSGKFGFQAGTRVPVVQQDGTIGTVASKDAAKALAQGLTLATQDQFKGAQYAAKYESTPMGAALGTVSAFGQGALRSLTLGTSDAAQLAILKAMPGGGEATAESAREYLSGQKAAHGFAEGTGQVAGFLAPALLSGGTSAGAQAGRAATIVPRGIMGAGRAVEGGVARMLGGGALARVGGAAAGAGTEAALMGVGHDISDAALENKPLTAEAMLAHGALNFATGAAIGGALKGGGEVLSRVLSRGGDVAAPGMSAKLDELSDAAFSRQIGITKPQLAKRLADGEYSIENFRAGRKLVQDELGSNYAASPEQVHEAAQSILERAGKERGAAVDALDRELTAKMPAKSPSTYARVADDAAELDVSGAIESPSLKGMYRGEKSMAERVSPIRMGKAPNAVDASLPSGTARSIDAALPENGAVNIHGTKLVEVSGSVPANTIAGPSFVRAAEELETKILPELRQFSGSLNKSAIAEVEALAADLRAAAETPSKTPFRDAFNMRRRIDKVINWNKGVTEGTVGDVRENLRGILEGEFKAAASEVAPELAAKYISSGKTFEAVADIAKAAEKRLAGDMALQQFSLGDKIMAGIGGGIGGIPGAIAGGIAGNVARSRGNMFAANAFGALAKLTSAERATTRVTNEITQSVKGFFSAAPRAYEVGAQAVTQSNVAKYMDSVAELNANPAAQAEKFAMSMGDLPKTAPELTQELAATNQRGLAFLASKLPPNRSGDGSLQPLAEKSALTTEQKRKWALYANTVNDPRSALKDLKQGRFTPEQAEALRVVYPQLYAVVQKAATEQLAAQKEKLPLAKSAALGTILGVPGAAALTPQRLQANQQVYQAPKPKGGRAPRVQSVAKAFQTSSQRLESR